MRSTVILVLLVLGVNSAEQSFETTIKTTIKISRNVVSRRCSQQLDDYVTNFSFNETSWALQMLDATSKIPSGIMSLNFGEMGNFDQCINIKATHSTIRGKYCLGRLSFTNATETSVEKSQASSLGLLGEVNQSGRAPGPVWAMCVPDGCNSSEASIIANSLFQAVISQQVYLDFTDMCQTVDDVHQNLSAGAITTIVILCLLLSAVLLASFYDMYCFFYEGRTCPPIIRAFSAYTNGSKLFKMSESTGDQLPCLNGLKFISMVWVVAGHQYSVSMVGQLVNTMDLMTWADSLHSMFLISGTLSVDTFLTIGGALMSFGYMKAKLKGIRFNVFLYYFHRYIRLTAPFALLILVSATLLKYMGSGPKWPYIDMYFQKNCERYWWSALLYVQNYVNVSEMCLGQTWYLSIDMQLYIISPLVFLALWKYPKYCLPFLGLCILAIIGLSFFVSWHYNLTALLTNMYGNSAEYDNKYYLLTHTRAAPWFIGIILGYFIYKIKQTQFKFHVDKYVVIGTWALCIATLLSCVLGGHSTLRSKQYDRLGNSFYIALVRPVWSVAISWIILACVGGYGGPVNWILSLPIYQVLNRFTYSVYLTHVTMLYMITYGKHTAMYFSDFEMAYEFWGTLWFSVGLSVLLVLTTESPTIALEKILLDKLSNRNQPTTEVNLESATPRRRMC